MSNFNQQEFNNFVLSAWVIGFFEKPITFKSWRVWNSYVNWRNATEDVYTIDKLSDYIINFAQYKWIDFDCFYWVPEWWTKLWIISQYKFVNSQDNYEKWSHILAMWRAKPKTHWAAKDKFFVWMPAWKVVVIEDTITTWWSLILTLDSLKESWVNIVWVIWLTDRNERRDDWKTPWEVIKEMWFNYYPMSHCKDLLPIAFKQQGLSGEIWEMTQEYYKRYWVEEIQLI